MDNMNWIKQPLTQLEMAVLNEACQQVLNPEGMKLLRRLMFEIGILREQQLVIEGLIELREYQNRK